MGTIAEEANVSETGDILDSQVVEVIGRQILVEQLLRAGIEVAAPIRDRGVDLVAYSERSADAPGFVAFPIQMKAASRRAWNIDRKYANIDGLILAYVWHVEEPAKAVVYAMTYGDAVGIAEACGYAGSPSWQDGGYYASSNPSANLMSLLEKHQMTPEAWRMLLEGSRRVAR